MIQNLKILSNLSDMDYNNVIFKLFVVLWFVESPNSFLSDFKNFFY